MCEEADESWDVFDERRVRARKQHTCVACTDPIEPGHVYFKTFTVFEGLVGGWKHCVRCNIMYRRLLTELPFSAWVDEKLNCGTSWNSAMGQDPPEDVARLAFVTAAEAQLLLVGPGIE
mgnify:CR=1 FL=1